MSESILDVIFNVMDTNEYKGMNNNLYHYTTPDGLLGILDKEGINLHFTRYDCVNDTSEGQNLMDIYRDSCSELLNENKINPDFFYKIKEIRPSKDHFTINKLDGDIPLIESAKSSAYICCFSLEQDSLPMWNYYSNDGRYQGYNIMFSDYLFNSSKSIIDRGFEIDLLKVIYDDNEKLCFWKSFINDLYKHKQEKDSLQNTINGIEIVLTQLQFSYKNSCFAHEKEIRAIVKIPEPQDKMKNNKPVLTIKHKSKNGYVVPYINVPIEFSSHLSGITIGPLVEEELSKSTIKDLIRQRGYRLRDNNIINSKVPIRF